MTIIKECEESYNHRKDFYESWVLESSQRLYYRNDFDVILNSLIGFMELSQPVYDFEQLNGL
jgi:hypothetical protein